MVYVTVKQPPRYRQMSLDEFLSMDYTQKCPEEEWDTANTRTYTVARVNQRLLDKISTRDLINALINFNVWTESLRTADRNSLYRQFKIPKRKGGLRTISAPNDELMEALRVLKRIFENDFHAMYHTSAFAYVQKRSVVEAVKRHQANESKWRAKFDLKDFFGSTNIDFVAKMFSMVFPFSEVMKNDRGREEMMKALDLCFLGGGLPQGTPISPLITNIMMIPIDHALANTLNNFDNHRFVYTRYADDFIVSSKYSFRYKNVEELIIGTLKKFDAPFTLNVSKTIYGSTAGSNWNLGIMLNKDNEITVGHKRKKLLQNKIHAYVLDRKNNIPWEIGDIQALLGDINWVRMVEGEVADRIVEHMNQKMNVNIVDMIKKDLAPA